MSDEYKTLNDAPIGEWIEIFSDHWFDCVVKCKGEYRAFVKIRSGEEWAVVNETEWRYPLDPLEQLENKLLDKWRSQGIDYAHDDLMDIPHRWILQVMLDAGADIERVK